MFTKTILRIFLIAIFIMVILNAAYANGGPVIGPNQAKIAAQNYIDSNNLTYTAVTPGWDDLQVEVMDTKTGVVKYISDSEYESEDLNSNDIIARYELLNGYPLWIVHVNDKNNKNIGQIYVDTNDGKVLKAIINGKVLKDIVNQKYPTDGKFYFMYIDIIGQIIQGILTIINIIFVIVLVGAGYWFYNRKKE